MHEDDLAAEVRRVLDATANAVDAAHGVPHPDRADLDRRIRRRVRRRNGAAAIAGALLLAAGVAGGALVASHADDHSARTDVASSGPTTTTTPTGVTVPQDVRLPVVESYPVFQERRTATSWSAGDYQNDIAVDVPAPFGWGVADRPAATVFVRTTADGTRLDVRANRFGGNPAAPGPCLPSGELYVGVRTDAAVGQVRGIRYEEVRSGSIVASGGVVGAAEGEPRWVVVAQVAPGVADVRATFPDGHRDHLAPVDGIVVLTAPVADGFDLTTLDAAASRLRVEALDHRDVAVAKSVSDAGTCGPDRLPAPGAEQPADPAAARAAVEAAWSTVFMSPLADDGALDAVDDPGGVAAARADLAGRYPPGTLEGTVNRITDLVFTDAATAIVQYRIQVPKLGYDRSGDLGEVRLVDGRWKVSRATVCGLYAQAARPARRKQLGPSEPRTHVR